MSKNGSDLMKRGDNTFFFIFSFALASSAKRGSVTANKN